MTRSEIARRTGLTRGTVWRMAAGMARLPARETVNRIERLCEQRGVEVPGKRR